ncbi:MAG: hypothetical protein WA815_04075 [Terracidiphilus sp.]
MSCCGQNRQTAAAVTPVATAVPAAQVKRVQPKSPALRDVASGPTVKLHYTGVTAIRLKGQRTGRMYVFTGAEPDRTVDRRDAVSLMQIGLFRRAI